MAKKRITGDARHAMKALTVAVLGGAIAINACAKDIRDQTEVVTGKAELVVPGMTAQQVAAQVKDALSQWAIPANVNFRSMPSTIPARPDEPSSTQKYYNGAPAVSYQCGTAYAEITKLPPPVKNAFAFIAEGLQACVYPFQKGAKVYLLHTRVKKLESLTSGLFGGITKAIQGTDDEWITKQMNENIALIKKNIPTLLVEKIEIPGAETQEPDKEAVAALIPEKVALPPPAPVQVQAVAQPQAVVAAPATPMQAKIEARKNLTGMGLQYHSQEQFVAAIRRKDDVAVQLFLDAGGIDLTAKEKGKTFETIASEAGAPEIAKMIAGKLAAPAPADTPAPAPAASPAPTAAAPLTTEQKRIATDKTLASFSPEDRAKIEEMMQSIPAEATPDQREAYRGQLITTYVSIKRFTDRIDPDTGRLR